MSTLLMRLAAPLQSWGVESKFERRTTGRIPSKSGVVGMCAAALGYKRWEAEKLRQLTGLRFGVRVDRAGALLKDFHMAHEESFWDSGDRSKVSRSKSSSSFLTNRYYLTDAAFLVGLEGEDEVLIEIDEALRYPVFPLYLGRRSCPPEGRVSLGVHQETLEIILERYPTIDNWNTYESVRSNGLRVVIDVSDSLDIRNSKNSYLLRDLPVSYDPIQRKHDYRSVSEYSIQIAMNVEDHDALATAEEVITCT